MTPEEKCGCGDGKHPKHEGRCQEWYRYPEVLEARQCGCGMTRENK